MKDIIYAPGGVYINGKWVGDYDWPISINIDTKKKNKRYFLTFQKIGYWIRSDACGLYCSVCGHHPPVTNVKYRGEKIWTLDPKTYNYCNHCGAKMDHSEAIR